METPTSHTHKHNGNQFQLLLLCEAYRVQTTRSFRYRQMREFLITVGNVEMMMIISLEKKMGATMSAFLEMCGVAILTALALCKLDRTNFVAFSVSWKNSLQDFPCSFGWLLWARWFEPGKRKRNPTTSRLLRHQ